MRNAALAPMPGDTSPAPATDDFTGLYREYHPQLFRYITHHFGPRDADEITQEALTRALRSLDRHRSEAETWAWLIRVARNVAHDIARSRRICESTDDDAVLCNDVPDDTVLPEPAALLDERRRLVRTALKMLPPSQRRILFLYEVDELSCPTIAGLMGSTEDAVRKALQRARRRFAAEIRTIGGGVCGSLVVVFRGLRRRARGVSVASTPAAFCALAGTFAITVGVHPGTPVMRPDFGAPAAAEVNAGRDVYDIGRTGGGVRGGAAGSAVVSGAAKAPHGGADTNLVTIPRTPLSPGSTTHVLHYEVDLPVFGPTHVDNDFTTDRSGGAVCNAGIPRVGCA